MPSRTPPCGAAAPASRICEESTCARTRVAGASLPPGPPISEAGTPPDMHAASTIFRDGVRERGAQAPAGAGDAPAQGLAKLSPVAKPSFVRVTRRERGGLGLRSGVRPGKAAASARVRFRWGELLARAPAAGLWAESGGLPVSLASIRPSWKDGGLGACWLRVENFVRASSPCVRLLLFGCCVLADFACGLSAFPVRTPSPGPESGATSTPDMALH